MKTHCPLLSVLCLGLAAALLSACSSTPPITANVNTDQSGAISGGVSSQVTSNLNVGATGAYDPASNNWSAGIVITFKDLPQANTQAALTAANARELDPRHYQLPQDTSRSPDDPVSVAIRTALTDPAFVAIQPVSHFPDQP